MSEITHMERYIADQFRERAGIEVLEVTRRAYPDEVNYIVLVREDDLAEAAPIGNALDDELPPSDRNIQSFVIVRKAPRDLTAAADSASIVRGVQDDRTTELVSLITARSRVSAVQPSLSYVRDARANIATAIAKRHHLIFGRRGAGKTALLVEAKRQVELDGALTAWVNVQSLRHQETPRIALLILDSITDALLSHQNLLPGASRTAAEVSRLSEQIRRLSSADKVSKTDVTRLYPLMQRTLARYLDTAGQPLYAFLDDFYYINRASQPEILDGLHACVRDADAWLKVSSIRHLSRSWQSSPPQGLQIGHDANIIDLDVTLQEPGRAKTFLESVLSTYCRGVGIPSLGRIFHATAMDRLVLASGAVPRDYLVLAASSIVRAQEREKARLVGVQDVNLAAGDAAGEKLQELEEDMASNVGIAQRTLQALGVVRDFCLQEKGYTYFLVDYRDKESSPDRYSILTDLMDVRLVHLLDAGVSDPHSAGRRYEAYLLDLSQFSGSRLKQRIHVIDFQGGKIVAKQTRTKSDVRVGDTARQVIAIFRAAPTFELDLLAI